jgi:hypothetical protein
MFSASWGLNCVLIVCKSGYSDEGEEDDDDDDDDDGSDDEEEKKCDVVEVVGKLVHK